MRVRLFDLFSELRSSYWFIPSAMILGAFLLSSLSLTLDRRIDFAALNLPLIYLSQPDGAKTLLGTVAGSMLSVASLTFSIVMVVLTMASSQFGPRLLGNFMRDRGNQVVLGSFISTFLYCLLILRAVRGAGDVVDSAAFVPQLSLTVALALAVINLGAFVYFIHHTTEGIQAANIIARVSDALTHKILGAFSERTLFPETVGRSPGAVGAEPSLPEAFENDRAAMSATEGGYLRAVDDEGLIRVAKEERLIVRLLHAPGAFVMRGGPLLEVYPASALAECEERLQNKFVLGKHRTPDQDIEFLFDQLLEVALRALSPGVNDPITAMRCIDRIADNLNLLANRDQPSPFRFDDAGALRLVIPVVEASALVPKLFGPIRGYGSGDFMTLDHVLSTLKTLSYQTNDPVFRQALFAEADRVDASAKAKLAGVDYERLQARHAKLREAVSAGA